MAARLRVLEWIGAERDVERRIDHADAARVNDELRQVGSDAQYIVRPPSAATCCPVR
jgi:hypothetical protein